MANVADVLKSKFAVVLTLVLLAEGALFYTAYAMERIPENRALDFFPTQFQGWQMIKESHVSKEEQEILRADDTLTRVYANESRQESGMLFVAYFKTQRSGQAPHSPKNCLPGSGWEPLKEGYLDVPVAGKSQPIRINHYITARGDAASVTLYWYQTRQRVIASEYAAKFWLVADSIRYHRSDTAIVKIVVPIENGDAARATKTGVDLVQSVFPVLQSYLPS